LQSLFITFEGPEGSGKTTQANLLVEALSARNLDVKLTREPGGDPVSEDIRRILLDSADHAVADRTELLLYLSARAQHTERVIIPHLEKGFTVVCARYTDSTLAYQGYGSGFDLDTINTLNTFATYGLVPDITFLLDIETEIGLKRQEDWNRMERKALEYHKRVRHGFLEVAKLHPSRIVVIDASKDIDSIHREIMRCVNDRLGVSSS